jgi:hypothetical protein
MSFFAVTAFFVSEFGLFPSHNFQLVTECVGISLQNNLSSSFPLPLEIAVVAALITGALRIAN